MKFKVGDTVRCKYVNELTIGLTGAGYSPGLEFVITRITYSSRHSPHLVLWNNKGTGVYSCSVTHSDYGLLTQEEKQRIKELNDEI